MICREIALRRPEALPEWLVRSVTNPASSRVSLPLFTLLAALTPRLSLSYTGLDEAVFDHHARLAGILPEIVVGAPAPSDESPFVFGLLLLLCGVLMGAGWSRLMSRGARVP